MNAIQQWEYGQLSGPEAAQQLGQILMQCFNTPAFSNAAYFERIGQENFRVLHQAGQIQGGLATLPMGQWFGGQRVSMVGLAAVGIAPEARGSGAALALLQQTLTELHQQQVALSTLYPATQRLYRKVGYEQGGSLCTWKLPTHQIQVQERSLPLIPISATDLALLQPLYYQQARLTPGYLDRHSAIWRGVTEPKAEEPVYAYLFGSKAQPEGYLIFTQQQIDGTAVLRLRDWVVLTPTAARRFWTFLADHRSQIETVHWQDDATSSLLLVLPEQTAKLHHRLNWMVRIVDLVSALSQRGYPASLTAELHLDIQDGLLPQNQGRFVLQVANGVGTVSRGGRSDLQLDIRGLAPLYTGLFTPLQLQRLGYLTADEAAIATATQIFAGPAPWMPDFF